MEYRYKYLLSDSANKMYQTIADQITNVNTVLDLGCGHSRWLEYYKGNAKVVGVDNNQEAIDYCRKKYKGRGYRFYCKDINWWNTKKKFDVVVLGGILYYSKQTVLNDVEKIIKKYSPKYIVIQEPMPIKSYNSPDFLPLLNKYSWTMHYVKCNMRMGERVVIKLDTTQTFEKQIEKDTDDYFDNNILKNGLYLVNTEFLNTSHDGNIKQYHNNKIYASVCAGFKSMYHACLNWDRTSDFEFNWFDVSPTAILFRQFMNRCLYQDSKTSFNEIWDRFKKEINPNALSITGEVDIDDIILTQLGELHISPYKWQKFLDAYAKSVHTYTRIDLVEHDKKFISIIKPNTWLWFSNVFDWHQFKSNEEFFWNWHDRLVDKKVILVGKFPPFGKNDIPWGTSGTQELELFKLINDNDISWWVSNKQGVVNWENFTKDKVLVRHNNYCTTMYNTHGKIKIYKEEENYKWAEHNRNCLKHLFETKYINHVQNNIMIECHGWYWGETVADILREKPSAKEFSYIITNEKIAELVADFILNIYKHKHDNEVFYSKDLKMENLIYDANKDKLVQIDFDYAISTLHIDFLHYARDYMIDDIFRKDMGHVKSKNLNRDMIRSLINDKLGLQ